MHLFLRMCNLFNFGKLSGQMQAKQVPLPWLSLPNSNVDLLFAISATSIQLNVLFHHQHF